MNSSINFKKENEIYKEKNNIYDYQKFQIAKNYQILNPQNNNNINELSKNNNEFISPFKSKPKFETNILYKRHKNINKKKNNINNKAQIDQNIKFNNSYKTDDINCLDINGINRNNHDLILNNNYIENQIGNFNESNTDIQNFKVPHYGIRNTFSKIVNKKKLDTKNIKKSNTYLNKNIFLLDSNNINKNSISYFKEDIVPSKISSITALNHNNIYRERIFNNKQYINPANVNIENINKRNAWYNNDFMEYHPQLKQKSKSYIIKVKNNSRKITIPKSLKKDSINYNNLI
jgi:hypothetical protein